MTDVNATMSELMRSGKLAGLGFGLPVKTLAVVDGKDYQKDFSLRGDSNLSVLYSMIQSEVPALRSEEQYEYRCVHVADEVLAMRLFGQRMKGNFSVNSSDVLLVKEVGNLCAAGVAIRSLTAVRIVN